MHREDFTLCNHKLSLFQAGKAGVYDRKVGVEEGKC